MNSPRRRLVSRVRRTSALVLAAKRSFIRPLMGISRFCTHPGSVKVSTWGLPMAMNRQRRAGRYCSRKRPWSA